MQTQTRETMPARIKMLPVDPIRGFPIPWFVAWIDGKPEFRVADAEKRVEAVLQKKCWVCGDYLGRNMTFVIGPMCGVNRTTAEPPCHLECARYSAVNCPFLSRPNMERRDHDDIVPNTTIDGFGIKRNPGVTLLWTCRDFAPFNDGKGGWLIQVGDHTAVEWFAEGRLATRAEVEESVRTGLPILQGMCQSVEDRLELARRVGLLTQIYPRE